MDIFHQFSVRDAQFASKPVGKYFFLVRKQIFQSYFLSVVVGVKVDEVQPVVLYALCADVATPTARDYTIRVKLYVVFPYIEL